MRVDSMQIRLTALFNCVSDRNIDGSIIIGLRAAPYQIFIDWGCVP